VKASLSIGGANFANARLPPRRATMTVDEHGDTSTLTVHLVD
jgi:hypothetical protein